MCQPKVSIKHSPCLENKISILERKTTSADAFLLQVLFITMCSLRPHHFLHTCSTVLFLWLVVVHHAFSSLPELGGKPVLYLFSTTCSSLCSTFYYPLSANARKQAMKGWIQFKFFSQVQRIWFHLNFWRVHCVPWRSTVRKQVCKVRMHWRYLFLFDIPPLSIIEWLLSM